MSGKKYENSKYTYIQTQPHTCIHLCVYMKKLTPMKVNLNILTCTLKMKPFDFLTLSHL